MLPTRHPTRARRLTDIAVRNLRPGATRREIPDAQQRGLYVTVHPTGRKTFVVRYRFAGRSRKLTLQVGITLAAARKEAAAALYQVEQGIDPAEAKLRAQADRGDTLQGVADEFFRREGAHLRVAKDWQRDLRFVFPTLGRRLIGDIRRRDIVHLLDKIEDERGPAAADKTLKIVSRIMNWHAARGDDFRTPIVRGMRRSKDRTRDRTLTDDELRAVWRAATDMANPFGYYIKFLLLTAARRNEAAHMTWSEITGSDWTLPAARNKTKKDLIRPLSGAVQAVLHDVPRIDGSPYVFSFDGRPIGGWSHRKRDLDELSGVTGWTLHDLRRSARSLMARAGVTTEIAERALGHTVGGMVGVYNRYGYAEELLRAYEALATLIEQIVRLS
jgi:integrase